MTNKNQYLQEIEHLLLKRQEELLSIEQSALEASKTVELDQTRVGRLSRMDAMQAQAMSVETGRRRKLELSGIESALKRLKSDDYGECFECGEIINKKRLLSNPNTELCIDCATEAER